MKPLITVLLLLIAIDASAQGTTRVRAIWDINPPSEGVDYYWVALNSNQQEQNIYVNGPNCNVPANNCYAEFDVANSTASNKVELWAHNQWGWSPEGAVIEFTFGVPTVPTNLRITTDTSGSTTGFSSVRKPTIDPVIRPGSQGDRTPQPPPIQRPPSIPTVK